ncbi:MAG: energy-coupling factor transporter transmembrane protein EcfT [Firmicutes bacterium]|nr:energy-coupling factor transporter transmembrane protein EcfT [Bacillota bacterium]
MPAFVEYVKGDSFLHRLNPMTKIVWTFVVIILSFRFAEPIILAGILMSNLLIALVGRVFNRILPVIKGLFVFALFLVVFQIFFVTEGQTLFYVIPYFHLGRITDVGLNLSLVMALRMVNTVSTIPILLMTTPVTDIVVLLVDKLRVPFKYAFILTIALRFFPTFLNEMEQILQAQMSRGYQADTRNPFKKLVIVVPLAIPLLVSAAKKAEKMAISMEVRGFGAGPRSNHREIIMSTADYMTLLALGTILISGLTF